MLLDLATARDAVDTLALCMIATGLVSTLLHRFSSFITLVAIQGLLLSGCAMAVAMATGEPHAYLALEIEPVISHKLAFVVAVGLTLLAYLVAGPIARAGSQAPPNALPAAVTLLLLGLFTMAIRGTALAQVVGLVMSENGIYLAAIAVTRGLPLAVELGVGVDILVGVLVMGLVVRQLDLIFASIHTDRLKALRG